MPLSRFLVVIVVVLALAGAAAWAIVSMVRPPVATTAAATSSVAGTPIGEAFNLIDQDGHAFSSDQLAGSWHLIFFGFTFCPSVCPTELQRLSDVLAVLGPKANQLKTLFITIDPERDTPAIMKEYLGHFDRRIIGLTGDAAAIQNVVSSYKVYAARVPLNDQDYTMDHSSFVYLFNPAGDLVKLYRPEDGVDDMAKDLAERLGSR